jgi:hypothetical protein
MSKASTWSIWYDDGSVYRHIDGPAKEAPLDGIVVIWEKCSDNQEVVHHGRDYYYWNGENWVSGERADLERWLRGVLPELKFGRWTKDSVFNKAKKDAEQWL